MTTYYDIPQGLVLSIALQEVWILQRSCPGLENVRYPHIYIYIISISIYIYMDTYVHAHTHTHIYIYIYIHTYIYIYIYINTSVCFIRVSLPTHVYTGRTRVFDYLMYVSCLKTFCGVAECPEARVTWPG